jgi:hypothetical protein
MIASGVNYYDCSATQTNVHIVTIDRTLQDSEIWLLDDPVPATSPTQLNLRTVEEHTQNYKALVGINGYDWTCPDTCLGTSCCNGVTFLHPGTPLTTTYETGTQLTVNTSTCNGGPCAEVLMGFAPGPNSLDLQAIHASNSSYSKYYYNLYGSNTSVIIGSMCVNQTFNNTTLNEWSIIGYSRTQVIFLTTGTKYTPMNLCPTLSAFGAEEAVLQDGSSTAEMSIQSTTLNKRIDPVGYNRHVAYALGLVHLYPLSIFNSGFEQPKLSAGQPSQRMLYQTPSDTLLGWVGPVDLHSSSDLVAHGDQIVDLNQDAAGYVQTQLSTPVNTYCLLRFFHGVNHHCASSATFDVQIGSAYAGLHTEQSFTSTYDPAGLQEEVLRFHATDSPMVLKFLSTTPGCGATIDDVSVVCTAPTDLPAATCADVLKADPHAASGTYLLSGPRGPWSTYCDMDPAHDGGGYTLVLKADGHNALFDWSSPLWSRNESSPEDLEMRNAQANFRPSGEARLDGYATIPVTSVELAMQESIDPNDPGYTPRFVRITPPDAMRGQTLLQVFSSGTPYYTSHGKDVWNGLLSSPSYQDECDIIQNHLEGFNVAYSDYGVATHARIGVLGDEADGGCHDPDSALGVGIGVGGASNCCYPGGPSTHQSTVGNTASNVFACGGNCSGFAGARDTKAFAYVFVR